MGGRCHLGLMNATATVLSGYTIGDLPALRVGLGDRLPPPQNQP